MTHELVITALLKEPAPKSAITTPMGSGYYLPLDKHLFVWYFKGLRLD
ncbi:hypothetical protein [Rhizobium ruizarguesonis]|nr:hypothetical protein [Rhizobium ruizarguesonis]